VTNNAEWISDTGASRQFFAKKELLQVKGNPTTARVIGKWKILRKFTSSKLQSLSNVLYVPS